MSDATEIIHDEHGNSYIYVDTVMDIILGLRDYCVNTSSLNEEDSKELENIIKSCSNPRRVVDWIILDFANRLRKHRRDLQATTQE